MRKQEYLQEAMQRENIAVTEAQRTIQQIRQTAQQAAQQEVRQEAHNYVGSVMNYAENQYQSKMGAAKAQAEKELREAKVQAEKEAKEATAKAKKEAEEATKRAKASEKSEHNTEHKSERTPDTRAKAKQRAGGSPSKPVPPFPTGERASGSQDNPEYTHEPKGKPGRPTNTKSKQIINQHHHQILNNHIRM